MAECRFRPLGGVDTGSDITSRYSDHGFLFVFCRHLQSILYRFDVIGAFLIAENGRKTISAARGRVTPEVKSAFDSLSPIWYMSALDFSAIFYLSKVIRLFRFACKMPFEIFGEEIFPVKNFFIDETPKGPCFSNPRRLRHRACKSVQWSGL
jgi:hypothetical protein